MRSIALNDRIAIVAGRDGYFMVNRMDLYVGQAIELYGEYNGFEAMLLQQMIGRGDIVVEVGANIGAHTVGLAKAVGPTGMVYAFEPQRACFALLQAQIALNQLANVYAFSEGVGRQRGRLFVPPTNYGALGNFGGIPLTNEESAEPVEVVTLDERLADVPCRLVKIDVEGMEEDVIRGGLNLIRKYHPLLYVENDRPDKSRDLVALIMAQGYRLWWHIPPLFREDNYFGVVPNVYGTVGSFNMICAREPHAACAGLREITSPDQPHPLAPPAAGGPR